MVKKIILFLICSLSQTIFCMQQIKHLYTHKLFNSPRIQRTFKDCQNTTTITPYPLFVYLTVEASNDTMFKKTYLPQIKERNVLYKDDGQKGWITYPAIPFFSILGFIPWDGDEKIQPFQRILLQDKEVMVIARAFCSKSIPQIRVVEFHEVDKGCTLIQDDQQHYHHVLEKYDALMKE